VPNIERVRIEVEFSDGEAWQLAQFIKRVRFEQALELTESGQSREARDEQAHAMLYALDLVAGALKVKGYAPR
jgi:hypothetical protein